MKNILLKVCWSFVIITLLTNCTKKNPSQETTPKYVAKIDSLLKNDVDNIFNGVVLISQNGEVKYQNTKGFADIEQKRALKLNDCFVIGSISKQITAVMVLQAYEKGQLNLQNTIDQYLPQIKQSWTRKVTIHHLLTHTHGITALDKPLQFAPGSQFQYSQLGYDLLARVLNKVTGKSFIELSKLLFDRCGMRHTFHPKYKKPTYLTKAYTEQNGGKLTLETNSFQNYVAAGSFISNATDLLLWNQHLYGNKLLKPSTYQLMETRYATRQHPIFGEIEYGYGLTFEKGESKVKIGALGFAPGYVSANFYFPESRTSIVILQNTARHLPNFKQTFGVHIKLLHIVKKALEAEK